MLRIINIIPQSRSGESRQDSEPNLAVNPARPTDMVATAFTPATSGSNAPIYITQDGGYTWETRQVLPGNGMFGTKDVTVGFATAGGTLYAGILHGITGDLHILRTANFAGSTVMGDLVTRPKVDQPWVVAVTATVGGAAQDRVYVGNEDGASRPQSASVDLSQNAAIAPAPAGFSTVRLEQRSTIFKDGPPIRLAVHADGTVYAAYQRWASGTFPDLTVDVVVSRDDGWGAGASSFQALADPAAPAGDGVVGRRVATGVFIRFNATMGQERLGGDLTIAVDPADSGNAWIAWCDRVGNPPGVPPQQGTDWTLHLRRSTDRGRNWSADLLTITNAKNPSLAVNGRGVVGLLYQQFTGTTWDTHVQLSRDAWATPARTLDLHTATASVPSLDFFPYLGDYVRLITVGNDFYGVFCGNNTPSTASFPNGVIYQRNANWATGTLLSTDGITPVAASIDPFCFRLTEDALHLLAATDAGGLWHTIRFDDQSWQTFFGDVKGVESNDPGYVAAVGAAGVRDELHALAVSDSGSLWHTIRHHDGSWQPSFGDVKAVHSNDPGYIAAASGAGVDDDLHVLAVTDVGGLWHTIRHRDGSWQPFFGDVKAVHPDDPGHVMAVDCADVSGDLHVVVETDNGLVWHTIRHPDGSWQPFFGNVKAVESNDPGFVTVVACAGVEQTASAPPALLVEVPDVLELRGAVALKMIRDAGLVPVISGVNSGTAWVATQHPAGGARVTLGSTVSIFLRTGPQP
ncbi:MAG TPA: PASTA domain-containing protein [Pseudonocardiaceae bacterium]|nr:PASTA domain-containing protein [Pseudonocardiaceae bacterium]